MSQYANVNNVSVKGIEGELRYDYNNSIQLVANASYLDEKNKTRYQANGKLI
jgi:outer membrane receptor protein involved in Fe transport